MQGPAQMMHALGIVAGATLAIALIAAVLRGAAARRAAVGRPCDVELM